MVEQLDTKSGHFTQGIPLEDQIQHLNTLTRQKRC